MIFFLGQQTPASDELYDIVVLEPVPSVWPLVFWSTLGVLLFAMIGVAIWYFLKGRKSGPGQSAAAKVRARLRSLENKRGELEPNQFTLAISNALKDYLTERFDDPVRYQTLQEFLERSSDSSSRLSVSAQEPLRRFLSESEALKFGNMIDADAKLEPLLKLAEEIVTVSEQVNDEKAGA